MGSSTSINSTGSGAMSPYMGSEENLAYEQPFSKRQLRKDYQIALQRIADLHGKIELTNYYLELYKNGSEQHRYDLYQEREALVIELERFAAYARTEEERVSDFTITFSFAFVLVRCIIANNISIFPQKLYFC